MGPWRGDSTVAHVVPLADSVPLTDAMVRHCCAVLGARGFTAVVTSALAQREQRGFLDDGFEVREELHLLAHDLHHLPALPVAPGGTRLRPGRRWHRARTLEVDALAFTPFWRLDQAGLREAMGATPRSRYRVASATTVLGYAVAGLAAERGYLQRLAVDPQATGRGIGAALVLDALHWMRDRGVARAVVNTQVDNERALALYLRLGFRVQPSGLAVLARPLVVRQPSR